MGYFGSFMGYSGAWWPFILGYLAFQEIPFYSNRDDCLFTRRFFLGPEERASDSEKIGASSLDLKASAGEDLGQKP